MSEALYEVAGLRFWRQDELRLRNRLKEALVDCVSSSLLNLNQMWRLEEVDTPVIMPRKLVSQSYDEGDLFLLQAHLGGEAALRAETTLGSYLLAARMLREGSARAPLCVYTMGQSFRRETNDGASASKLRFNAFYQLEFQCIYATDTKADVKAVVREALVPLVEKLTGLPTRLIPSDRLPSYAEETVDVEVDRGEGQWKEVASTSIRTDFPEIPSHKSYRVFEVAFGMDRMVAVTRGEI